MYAIPFHVVGFSEMHLSGLGLDDFICFGLIAIVLVVVTFVVKGGEKAEEKTANVESPRSSEK